MDTQNDVGPTDRDGIQMNAEMREWIIGFRCMFVVCNVLPLFICTRVLLATPKFEQLFLDMLGSKQKLPVLTGFVLDWSLPLLGCIWLVAVLATFLVFSMKRARFAWIAAVVSTLAFIASVFMILAVLLLPYIVVIKNISGGESLP